MNNTTFHKKTSIRKSGRKHAIIGTPIRIGRRVIGQVVGDVFQKDIISKWILERPFLSIASDISALHDAERAGAEYVEFTCTDTGVIYKASIAKFWTLGKFINYVSPQQTLGLEHFEHRRDPEYTEHTHTDAQEYSDSDSTHDVKPLVYKSHAITGIVYNGVKVDSIKQLDMFGKDKGGE